MFFLSPLALLLAAAAAVPLLIHLMRRRIGVRVEFPAARYLARAEREHSRNLRLRNLLLMLLRVLAVLAIALAAARPLGHVPGRGHAPTALAVLLDNSLSSSAVSAGKPVLDELRGVAAAVLGEGSANDRLWLVTADARVTGGRAAELSRTVAETRPLAGAGRLDEALARAVALVRGSGLGARVVVVVTDGQASSWRAPAAPAGVRIVVHRARGSAPANHAVASAVASPPRWLPRGAVDVRVLASDTAAFRVTLGRTAASARTVARGLAAPGAETRVAIAPEERGWLAGAVELEPDELRGDDGRWFAVDVSDPPGVRVDSSAGPFAASAVATLTDAGRVGVGSGIAVVAADAATKLPALMIAPADPVRLGAANRALERLGVPWRFGAPRRGAVGLTSVAAGAPALDGVTATLRYPLVPEAGAAADTLARAGEEPWIVAGTGYALVGSPLLPDATLLPARAPFVPWLELLLAGRLAGGGGEAIAAAPGAVVRRPSWADAIEGADGARAPLDGATLSAPERPGVYFLTRDRARVGALVVNPESEESVLERLGDRELVARLGGRDVVVAATGEDAVASAFGASSRRPLGGAFLAAGLVLLVLEAFLAGARRPAAPAARAA